MTGVLAPMKGKSITCTASLTGTPVFYAYGYSKVDAITGTIYTRCINDVGVDTGWVSGLTAAATNCTATTSMDGLTFAAKRSSFPAGNSSCSNTWPLN